MKKGFSHFLLSLLIVSFSPFMYAKRNTSTIKIKGTVVSPSCTINNERKIYIDFGDAISIEGVKSGKVKKEIPYSVTCDAYNDSWKAILSISTANVFSQDSDNASIATTKKNLGIKIYANGKPLKIGEALPIDIKSPPFLEAKLIQGQTSPGEGSFSATANIEVNYQ